MIYPTTAKLAETRYALYSELWGLRRQAHRTSQEIEELRSQLAQIQPADLRRVSQKMRRARRTLETKLSDKQAFIQALNHEAREKRDRLLRVEVALRAEYKEAMRGNILDPHPTDNLPISPSGPKLANREDDYEYDLFISHATEDKPNPVRPLVARLEHLGLRVWYDETELSIGDSLRQCIDWGLSRSRYGVVVISEHFLTKKQPRYELDSLVALEIERGKVILPIWHGITKHQLLRASPKLADKVALNTESRTLDDIALEIAITVMERH